MRKRSVFNYPFSRRYYLLHPWVFIKESFQNIYHAYRRAVYGWTWEDCWNMDNWFCEVVPEMLKYLSENSVAYPGPHTEWDTPEKWHDWLHSVADLIDLQNIDEDEENEFAEEFHHLCEIYSRTSKDEKGSTYSQIDDNDGHFQEIKELYYARAQEIHAARKKSLESAMIEFSRGITEGVLWD